MVIPICIACGASIFPQRSHSSTSGPLRDALPRPSGDAAAPRSLGALITLALQEVDVLISAVAEHGAAETEDDERRLRSGVALKYIDANRDGIASNARRGAQASGPIENVLDVVVGRRLKAKGTCWHRPGADRIRQLRVLKENKSWTPDAGIRDASPGVRGEGVDNSGSVEKCDQALRRPPRVTSMAARLRSIDRLRASGLVPL
ncbi:MAG: hypothetical protein ACRENL_11085 [Candidatus Dormibacteria bacterium]